jgi:hypothetical protein
MPKKGINVGANALSAPMHDPKASILGAIGLQCAMKREDSRYSSCRRARSIKRKVTNATAVKRTADQEGIDGAAQERDIPTRDPGSHSRPRLPGAARYCNSGRCHHSAGMNADWLPDVTPVRSLCRRMVCTQCRMIGADVRPDWGRTSTSGTFELRTSAMIRLRTKNRWETLPPLRATSRPEQVQQTEQATR